MSGIPELRVHGVSGTHPRSMLYTDPLPRPDGKDSFNRVYRRPMGEDAAEAFHWGGMTSGAPLTAFWLLLLPFALVNTAGWMAAPNSPRRPFVAAVRLAGLMLTAVMVIQGLIILVDLPWQGLVGEPVHPWLGWAWAQPRLAAALLAAAATGLLALLTRVASRSHFEQRSTAWDRVWNPRLEAMIPDPAHARDDSDLALSPSAEAMWSWHANPERLTRIHIGWGLSLIGMVMASGAAEGLVAAPQTLAGAVNLGLLILNAALILLAGLATGRGIIDRLIAWLPVSSLTGAMAGIVAFLRSEVVPGGRLDGLYDLGFSAVALLAVAVVVVSFFKFITRPSALIILGAVTGGGLGAGLAMAMERVLGLQNALPDGLGWFAAASLYGFLSLLVLGGLLLALRSRGRHPLQALRETIPALGTVFHLIFIPTAAVMVTVVALRRHDLFGSDLPSIESIAGIGIGALILYLLAAALLALSFLWMKRPRAALLTLAVAAVLLIVVRLGIPRTQLLGVPLDLGTFPSIAATASVLLPASFIVTRIISGLRNQDRRRGIGILWDLAGMWPRWYHPFAPPPYGPRVVTDLCDEVTARLQAGPFLLAAHSQGSVLAAVVAHRLDPAERSRLGLITYGSPLASLYGNFFPAHFSGEWLAALAQELTVEGEGRWRNLWRESDPIGGPIDGVAHEAPLPTTRVGHGGYELEPAYLAERTRIQRLLD